MVSVLVLSSSTAVSLDVILSVDRHVIQHCLTVILAIHSHVVVRVEVEAEVAEAEAAVVLDTVVMVYSVRVPEKSVM